jgi:PAS domain S-box-containing protein
MKTVVLAYEREQDLTAVETLLQTRGHRVLRVRSGIDALECLRRERADVVVADVMLPKLDGFALCRRLKEDPALEHIPVLLHSLRVEGAKYEAFAAEVCAERFIPRTATLEELVEAVEAQKTGSGTVRVPALVPELIEKREQDRKRLQDLEQQLADAESKLHQLEAANRKLVAANEALLNVESEIKSDAERQLRERTDAAVADAARIRELQERVRELESSQQQLEQSEQRARGAAEESRSEMARISVLETRLGELQASRARAQAARADADRVFASQPLPTWLCDMETWQLLLMSDTAAALFARDLAEHRQLGLQELLPGFQPPKDPSSPLVHTLQRAGADPVALEIRRQSVSYSGRACWLMVARDVTAEIAARARAERDALHAAAYAGAADAVCVVDQEGKLLDANAAFSRLTGHGADEIATLSLRGLEVDENVDSTVRGAALRTDAAATYETRWKHKDGSTLVVDVASSVVEPQSLRVLVVREATQRKRLEARSRSELERTAGLLDIAQRTHSLTETELVSEALGLLQKVSSSEHACAFLCLAEAPNVELAGYLRNGQAPQASSVFGRWRGTPPEGSALFECLDSQRFVSRESAEGLGQLQQAGLPETFGRQLAAPIMDGGRAVGVIVLADKGAPYDDDDRLHLSEVAEALWKAVRRRRSDGEIVSAMDHMERVMLGAVESLAVLSEAQDACKTGRARRIADLAASIGDAMGLPGHTIRGLRVTGQLIDIGMLQIPREILWRPGQLSAAEFDLVKTHPERGFELLRRIEFPWPVAETVRQHHERLDGSGYPRGLRGDDILTEARVIAVADAVEAMLSPRPHRAALPMTACIEELQSQAGRRYDPRVVKACVKLLREKEPGAASEPAAGLRIA